MNIAVVGLWHLGCVTAACLAQAGHSVFAYDPNPKIIDQLRQGETPLFEPGLTPLLMQGHQSGHLHFVDQPAALHQADIVWITFDTPVNDQDVANVEEVTQNIEALFPHLQHNTLVLISSQLPVGTTRQLQQRCSNKTITFAYSPENLRLGKAIEVFTQSERIIVGLQEETDKLRVQQLLQPFTPQLIWMSIESAEMTKHALNAFLATSVVFINELATLCERVGANAGEVERGLKSEARIGPKAYLRPGNAIAGGTLARDVNYLIQIGQRQDMQTPFFSALLESNQAHKQWTCRRILQKMKNLKNKTITALGLTYKAGTDTLRRSIAVETCQWLSQQGAIVKAYDPTLTSLPPDLTSFIQLNLSLKDALKEADAIFISTDHPEFMALNANELVMHTQQPMVFDPSGFLANHLSGDSRIHYFSVGR